MRNYYQSIQSKLNSFLLITLFLTTNTAFAISLKPESTSVKNYNSEILSKIPNGKGTVGTVLLYMHNKTPYILLARERIDGNDESKAGTFSDLGGRVEGTKNNFAIQTIRELNEETVGAFKLTENDLIEKAYVIYKNNNGRDVIYSIYPVDELQFTLLKSLNDIRSQAVLDPKTPYSHVEKDLFLWLPVKKLLEAENNGEFNIMDIDNKIHRIKLRKFFVNDCLKNEDFRRAITAMAK